MLFRPLLLVLLAATLPSCLTVDSKKKESPAKTKAAVEALGAEGAIAGTTLVSGELILQRIRRSGKKATLVNAWASWCGPCRQEFPMLVKLRQEFASKDVDFLFVSVDDEETQGKAVTFAGENGVVAPVLVAEPPLNNFINTIHPDWPGMIPATFLFDAEGKLRYFWGGPVLETEVRPVVEGFLAGKNIDGEQRYGLIPGRDARMDEPKR